MLVCLPYSIHCYIENPLKCRSKSFEQPEMNERWSNKSWLTSFLLFALYFSLTASNVLVIVLDDIVICICVLVCWCAGVLCIDAIKFVSVINVFYLHRINNPSLLNNCGCVSKCPISLCKFLCQYIDWPPPMSVSWNISAVTFDL